MEGSWKSHWISAFDFCMNHARVIFSFHQCMMSFYFQSDSPKQESKPGMYVIVMPPPLGAGGIMFSGCPSVRPSVRSLKYPLLTCTLVHPTNRNRFTACPSVRPSGEVSGHLPENAWREWPEILHADVSWPSSELISLWPRSVDFSNFGAILT